MCPQTGENCWKTPTSTFNATHAELSNRLSNNFHPIFKFLTDEKHIMFIVLKESTDYGNNIAIDKLFTSVYNNIGG